MDDWVRQLRPQIAGYSLGDLGEGFLAFLLGLLGLVLGVLLGLLVSALLCALLAYPLLWSWNASVAKIFSLPLLDFNRAFCLLMTLAVARLLLASVSQRSQQNPS